MRRRALLASLVGLAAGGSCLGGDTEVVLRIDTDICAGNTEAPLESVRVEVRRDRGELLWASEFNVDRFVLPGEVVLQPERTDVTSAPVRVQITGSFRPGADGVAQEPLVRSFRVAFARGRRQLLGVYLANRCRNGAVRCRDGFTCGRSRCEAVDQPNLPNYSSATPDLRTCVVDPPVAPSGDGGVDVPPGVDVPVVPRDVPVMPDTPGVCTGGRTACGSACVDTASDRANCGACGNACVTGRSCIEGACDPRETGFGGSLGFGPPTQCFTASDDGSWNGPGIASETEAQPIPMSVTFPSGINFFGRRFEDFYVNTNGNITLRAPLRDFAPRPFPINGLPMFAPLWSDVDARNGGSPDRNMVCFGLDATRLAVTWHKVERFSRRSDQLNSFQLILRRVTSGAVDDWDLEYRYARCEWATWDPPNADAGPVGGPARAGLNAGDTVDSYTLPPSGDPARVRELCTGSNSGRPGVWVIRSRSGRLIP